MWTKPWKYSEGFIIGAGSFLLGTVLQLLVGPIKWSLFAWPVNIIVLLVLLACITVLYLVKKRFYIARWLMSIQAAVPAMAFCAVQTLVMGLSGWSMLDFWPLVLSYLWVDLIVGLACLNRICHFKWSSVPFLCNHVGLFIALTAATLGSSDRIQLNVSTVEEGEPAVHAIDDEGFVQELGMSIQLHDFIMELYPSDFVFLDGDGMLLDDAERPEWSIAKVQELPLAFPVDDGASFEASVEVGAAPAAEIVVTNKTTGESISGWVSCGSFLLPYFDLELDRNTMVAMANPQPKRFASDVTVTSDNGKSVNALVEVNKPLKFEGWHIYQLGYDEKLGVWSDTSVLQLVKNPWLPLVDIGIIMLLVGAVFNFLTAAKKKEEK